MRFLMDCVRRWKLINIRLKHRINASFIWHPHDENTLNEEPITSKLPYMAKKNGQSVRRAAKEVSKIMAASLSQFSLAEQNRRLKAIHKIALSAEGRQSRYRMTHEA